MSEEDKEYDIYRDSLLRYAGYANECGEAFRAQTAKYTVGGFNGPVSLTYAISVGYCAADAYDKYKKTGKLAGFVDALGWQLAASVIIPGFTIHQVCHYSGVGLAKTIPKVPLPRRQLMVSAIGLATIPFIIHPIDHAVDWVFDKFPRKYLYNLDN